MAETFSCQGNLLLKTGRLVEENPVELSGAEIVVQALKDEGVEHIFGYPGGAVLHIYDAIFQQEDVKHVLVRHEQGACHR